MFARLALGRLMPWLIGVALSSVVFGGGFLWHQWQTGKLEKELTQANAEITEFRGNARRWQLHSEQLQEQMEHERDERRRAEVAVHDLLLELGEEKEKENSLLIAVEEAPLADDAPVAPVLERALEGLSQ